MLQRHKTDYQLRADILSNRTDLLKDISNAQFNEYKDYQLNENGVIINDKFHNDNALTIQDILERENYSIECYESFKILSSTRRRKCFLKDRIISIYNDSVSIDYTCYFITLDFSDNFISRTSETTRRRYVQRFLKEHCRHYVANIDYGVDDNYTKREHYHAFVSSNNYRNMIHDWHTLTGSGINIKKLRVYKNMNKTYRRLSMYISKLTNHAIKQSVKRNVYIYDRNKDYAKS